MPLRIFLDRNLPIPISVQLKGQIEYGIVSGTLKRGERLPSVRELAQAEGLAHVTVSHVYSALKREGLISVRPGMGTYVAGSGDIWRDGDGLGDLHRLVDGLVASALDRGFTPRQIGQAVTARLVNGNGVAHHPVVALVGLFDHATSVYAGAVAALLADLSPDVASYTIEGLRADMGACERTRHADVVLTLANRVKEVQDLLGPAHPPVRSLAFVPHPETVRRLQALPRGISLGIISTFAEFLPTMLHGIGDCIPLERAPLCAVLADEKRVGAILRSADAIIFASGSEAILGRVPRDKPALEYLHTPEPSSVYEVRRHLVRLPVIAGRMNTERRLKQEA